MSLIDQTSLRNVLLRHLQPEDFALLAPHLTPVEMRKGDVLSAPDEPFERAYFLERGIGSIIATARDGPMVESGLFGRDGFAPTGLALGAGCSPHRNVVQVAGDGHCMPVEALREAMVASRPLHELLLRFIHALSVQTAYTALSNAVHPVDERLARWLLMCHDRSGDEMALTHEFMGVMLAVRRPTVTTALHVLEGEGFIRAARGVIVIRDRQGLEEFAANGYGRPEAEYERLIGPLR